MIELSETIILEAVLIGTIGATILGTLMSASVIFEADGYLEEHQLSVEEAQSVKRKKFMPRLRAPMYAGFAGEILLFIMTLIGTTKDAAMAILAMTTVLFLVFIIYLGIHFYRAGRASKDSD
jgi:hypothetical protein